MSDHLSQYIFKKNSTSLRYKIFIRNETSHTILDKSEFIHLIELKENGISLSIPINTCQLGHVLSIFFIDFEKNHLNKIPINGEFKESAFSGLGKVFNIEINKQYPEYVLIEINFTQYDVITWEKVLEEYKARQNEVTERLSSQKGDK